MECRGKEFERVEVLPSTTKLSENLEVYMFINIETYTLEFKNSVEKKSTGLKNL